MKIVFATNNLHKREEVAAVLGNSFEIISLSEIGCTEEIPETCQTLEGNALQKARYVKEKYGLDCFADDTGLEVKALDGRPGVHSARYAGNHDSEANMNRLLHELKDCTDRTARFRTVVALVIYGKEYLFEGIVNGTIGKEKHGNEGFGYDPIFIPDGYSQSFAELGQDVKNTISHRSKAIAKLADFLKEIKQE